MSLSQMTMEILAIVEPLMDNCLAGSTERDHAKHVRDFTDRLRAIVRRKTWRLSDRPAHQRLFRRTRADRHFRGGPRRRRLAPVLTKAKGEFMAMPSLSKKRPVLIDHCLIC